MALLRVEKMTHFFGGLRAVYDYNLGLEPGEVRGLIGPNGAGKTTIFNLITGIYKPTEGYVFLEDKRPNAPRNCSHGYRTYLSKYASVAPYDRA